MSQYMQWSIVVLGALVGSHGISQAGTPPPNASASPSHLPRAAQTADLGFQWKSHLKQLVVDSVRPESPAAEANFRAGDVILKVEGKPVATPKAFEERVATFAAGQRIKIHFNRANAAHDGLLALPGAETVTSLIHFNYPVDLPAQYARYPRQGHDIQMKDGLAHQEGKLYTGQARYGGDPAVATGVRGLSTFDHGRQIHFVEWVNGKKHGEYWPLEKRDVRYGPKGEIIEENRHR